MCLNLRIQYQEKDFFQIFTRPKTKVHPLARVLFLLENWVFIQIWANYLGMVKSNEVCEKFVYLLFILFLVIPILFVW